MCLLFRVQITGRPKDEVRLRKHNDELEARLKKKDEVIAEIVS